MLARGPRRKGSAKDKILRYLQGLLLLSLGLILPSGAETFRNPRHIAIPSNPQQVGTADFNGDGRLDFYYTDATGVNVILANADGGYAAPQTTSLGTVTGCRAADFNGDGFADAVCFTPEWATQPLAAIFIGNGDGTLRAADTSPVSGASGAFAFVAFADINSDGNLDILLKDLNSEVLYTWFGDGAGQFHNLVSSGFALFDQSWPTKGVTVADVNGDGHADIVFADDPLVMLGVGDGTFTGAYTAGPWIGCHLADFDKDGHLDLFCTLLNYKNGESYLEIHHGNGDGTFTKTPVFSKGYSNADFTQPFAARDLDGDGYLDILALSSDGLVIFFGRSGVHFAAPVHYAFYNVGGFDEDQGDPTLIADYDLDGNLDLAMPGVNGIYITYGRADGTFDAPPVIRSGATTGYSVVADFNEDGTPDIFTSGTDGLQLLLGKGNGTFALPVGVQTSPPPVPLYYGPFAMLYLGDFNGDKNEDVIALGGGLPLPQLFLGRGNGTFQDPLSVTNLLTGSSYAIADVNRDGRDDLLDVILDPASATGTVDVLLSNGDGTLNPITTTLPGNGYSYGLPASADFNNDGKPDLVMSTSPAIQVLSGKGDGTFDPQSQTLSIPSFGGQPCASARSIVTGDFDHDGEADFAVLCLHSGNEYTVGPTALFVYYGNGDGSFSQAITAAVLDRAYNNVIAAYLNGDRLSDFILSTNEVNGVAPDYRGTAISIVHSLPGRKFSAETNLIAGEGLVSMAAADFNRDGQPDLLFTNGGLADSVVLLTNIGTPALTLTSSANPSAIGQEVTFTAAITAPGDLTAHPSAGNITFEGTPDGKVTVPITFEGGSGKPFAATAIYETAGLPVGSTLITATFAGDSLLNPASASLTQVVNPPPSYQLVASPTTLEVKAGSTGNNSVTVTVQSLYGFAATVSLSCKVSYVGSGTDASPPTCGFGTNPLAVKGSDLSTQLILSTTAAPAADKKMAANGGLGKTGIVFWGGALLLLLPGRRRYRWLARAIMILMVSGSMLLSLSSCGGTSAALPPTAPPGSGGTPPPTAPPSTQTRNYTITVSATSDTTATPPPPVSVQLTID
jgi:hypothetical protein